MPVDYTLAENPDGSKTIWFGETERRHRMRWIIGITLYPDKSYMEVTVKTFNRTAIPHSMLYWANVAVHANDDYQVIFPPSVSAATYHSKNDFSHWPISNEVYRGTDYRGVDLTWWKNHPEPVSFFAWNLQEDFSGGYDHGKRAGVVHMGNHNIVCGAKLWEWGPGLRVRMWDKILTVTDGPYAELMVGAFSDNQPDYYQLAELSCRKGDFTAALEQIDRSLSTNAVNTKALSVKAMILRKLGRPGEAKQIASDVLVIDPLDFLAMNELYLAQIASGRQSRAKKVLAGLERKMAGQVESYLELAVDYGNCGLWDEAVEVLLRPVEHKLDFAGTYPMVHYYLAYFHSSTGDDTGASKYLSQAARMPTDYCFPFRLESIDVLNFAIARNPSDARAFYYLGDLLYDLQPQKAIELWEKSRQKDDSLAIVHRNLGWAYYRTEQDVPKAVASYEKAVARNRRDARLYYELDRLYEAGNVSLDRRLALFENNHEIVAQRNDSFLREIMVMILAGRYDEALGYLAGNHFHVHEGGGQIHDVYVDGCLLRGSQRLRDGRFEEALKDFHAASEYPENLSVGRPRNDRRAPQVAYYVATAYEALGNTEKAAEYYAKAAEQRGAGGSSEARFYQGLSFDELGRRSEADRIFDELIESGKRRLAERDVVDVFAKFGEGQTVAARKASAHYAIGLGHLGKGASDKAKTEFEKAVELDVSHVWARARLAELDER